MSSKMTVTLLLQLGCFRLGPKLVLFLNNGNLFAGNTSLDNAPDIRHDPD